MTCVSLSCGHRDDRDKPQRSRTELKRVREFFEMPQDIDTKIQRYRYKQKITETFERKKIKTSSLIQSSIITSSKSSILMGSGRSKPGTKGGAGGADRRASVKAGESQQPGTATVAKTRRGLPWLMVNRKNKGNGESFQTAFLCGEDDSGIARGRASRKIETYGENSDKC